MDLDLALWGLFWGALSALSLPLGAVLGLWTKPSKKVTSSLMAFGAGALLFALTIELFGHALHEASDGRGGIADHLLVVSTMVAAVLGGLLFEALNHILNDKGAFLRKDSQQKRHLSRQKLKTAKKLVKGLAKSGFFRSLPARDVIRIFPYIRTVTRNEGEIVFEEGDPGDRMYFVVSGRVDITRGSASGESDIASLGKGDVFGEMALVSRRSRSATAVARTPVVLWELHEEDLDRVLKATPRFQRAVQSTISNRIQNLAESQHVEPADAAEWEESALDNLRRISIEVSHAEVAEAVAEHRSKGGAALAIWLGILLDGIPESLVIGMLVVSAAASGSGMSLAFIAGVFLANLPEAMSSAVTMQKDGMRTRKILWMWLSLCLMTGVGALVGALLFPPTPEGWLVYFIYGIEGLAAGAMLTMIAETMLPEAFEQGGGTVVGLSTLAGFLAALGVKLVH